MRRALDLARRGRGDGPLPSTHPNPCVGSCLVSPPPSVDPAPSPSPSRGEGVLVGEGFHPRAGLPHAEVYALRAAGPRARGATAYVTLEPCAHHGRTPPCARALVAAGVARVVVGVVDPNPLVGGKAREREGGKENGREVDRGRWIDPSIQDRDTHRGRDGGGGGEGDGGRDTPETPPTPPLTSASPKPILSPCPKGVAILEAAGIVVERVGGAEEAEAEAINEDWMRRMRAEAEGGVGGG